MSSDKPNRQGQAEQTPNRSAETKPQTSLVGMGIGAWVGGYLVTRVAYGLIGDGEMTPMPRGLLLGGSIIQVIGSAILLFCFVRFIFRKVTGKT